MNVILGIDMGTSTTKVVALSEDERVLSSRRKASIGKIEGLREMVRSLSEEMAEQSDEIVKIMMTGVGASFIDEDLLGIPTYHVTEFESQGRGGLFLGGLERGVVCSIGTGSTIVLAGPEGYTHMGGSAVGGGTLTGLGSRLFGLSDARDIAKLAEGGNLRQVDWHMDEINQEVIATLPGFATASNLGKMKPEATDADVALGLFNMIYQTAGVMASMVARHAGTDDIVAVGSLAQFDHAKVLLGQVAELYHMHFIIPQMPAYGTAIGAALAGLKKA